MSVHPDLTAHRAVDACGGTHKKPTNDFAEGFVAGFDHALGVATEAVKKPDALMNEMLEALDNLVALTEPSRPDAEQVEVARAVILKAKGEA